MSEFAEKCADSVTFDVTHSAFHLLAEAGATSVDWYLFSASVVLKQWKTSGLNPETMKTDALLRQIGQELERETAGHTPVKIWYYGAGVSNPAMANRIQTWLQGHFSAAAVEIHHDLLAACRATCGDKPGVVAILGTGSVACCYDGQEISEMAGGHGWLFGDEGSGGDLGKALIKKCLDGQISTEIVQKLEKFAGMPLLEIRKTVYQSEKPGSEMAQFAVFLKENIAWIEIRELVEERFQCFADRALRPLSGAGLDLYFVGSVAHHFGDELLAACAGLPGRVACRLPQPGPALVAWHQARL